MNEEQETVKTEENKYYDWAEFLAKHPPNDTVQIMNLFHGRNEVRDGKRVYDICSPPTIQIHCDSKECNGVRYFDTPVLRYNDHTVVFNTLIFLKYCCRHCKKSEKVYAIKVSHLVEGTDGTIVKIGEWPPFGPTTPAKVVKLIGSDKDLFIKGRRCETQGLGIGAFVYYRRVIENQKDRLIDEIIRASKKIKADDLIIRTLEEAKKETQFKKSIEIIKDAIPEVLKINGHNPLTLLHNALSEGLHAQSDHECLELATSIRVILCELSERLQIALKEEKELQEAISRLFK